MISRTRTRALLAACVLLLSSCITIEEHYTFKKDGSGTMTYVLDMREMGKLLKDFGDKGKKEGADGMGQLSVGPHAAGLRQIAGISKVKVDDRTEWVQRLSFSFKDMAALNRALNILMPDSTGGEHAFFSMENGALVRTTNGYMSQLASTMANSSTASGEGEEDDENSIDVNGMLGMMKYKYSFKFKQAVEGTEASSALVKEESGSKEVKYSTDWAAIAKDPTVLDFRIRLKGN